MRPLAIALLLAVSPPAFATALSVALVSGATYGVPHDYTGNGAGFAMGAFEITNPHTEGLVLLDVTLTAIGSGDDSSAFSEIGIFIDDNGNGAYDPGLDVRYGIPYSAYPVDDGSRIFSMATAFAPGEVRRFFIVGKMSGVATIVFQDVFRTIVSSITATGGAPTGLPTPFSDAVVVIRTPTPLALEYEVSGTAPPYNYSFRLVLDNHDGSWTPGQDWSGPVFGQAVFGSGGMAPFTGWITNAGSYPVGPFTTTPWVTTSVAGVSYNAPGLFDNVSPTEWWVPASIGEQLVWWGTANTFLNDSQMAWSMQRRFGPTVPGSASLEPAHRVGDYLRVAAVPGAALDASPSATGGGNGFLIGSFDVVSHSNAATFSGLTLSASGSGDDSLAFSSVRLFVDSNSNGAYDPGVDTQFGQNFSAYPADNGSLTFTDTLNFNPNETKRLLVVVMLNGATLASFGQTFDTTVTSINATGFMHSGLPTAVMPGIHIEAPTLTLATTGAALSIHGSAHGPGGIGVQACEFTLANNAVGVGNLGSISVTAAGSVFDHTAFSRVALYEDSNASGALDAADTLYGTAGAFPADDGTLTFSQAITFAAGQTRRFFVAVELNGTAQTGDDFWLQISALGVSGGTETSGVPGVLEHALTIDNAQPQLAVTRAAAAISNGGTDVMGAIPAGVAQSVTYTITNNGPVNLDLTGATLVALTAGANVSGLTVVTPPAATIAPGGSTTFTISYTATGAFDFTISVESTDPGNDPYTWTATGTTTGGGGSGSGGDSDISGGGCSTGDHSSLGWLAWLGVLTLLGWRFRRRRA
jgi:MYXO-CTERM domain-containing protein